MLNRFSAIQYPIQAQAFNHIKISQSETVDYWHDNLSRIYKKVPGWIYTSSKNKNKISEIEMPSKEAIRFYLERIGKSERDLQDSIKLFGKEALAPIIKIEKIMKE
jgi:hypothetical protein